MGSEIDPAAESMTKKRSPESSSALAEASPKRPCAGTHNDSDSFEEFFALLQRIEATKRHCGGNGQEPAAKCIETGKADDAKAVASQVLWRPSFEWEDFLPRGNRTCDVDSKTGERDLKGKEREEERFSSDASMEGDRMLDLNLPLEMVPL